LPADLQHHLVQCQLRHPPLQSPVLFLELFELEDLVSLQPLCFCQRYKVCSVIPTCRISSATGDPDLGLFSALPRSASPKTASASFGKSSFVGFCRKLTPQTVNLRGADPRLVVVRTLGKSNGKWDFADTKRTRSRRVIQVQTWARRCTNIPLATRDNSSRCRLDGLVTKRSESSDRYKHLSGGSSVVASTPCRTCGDNAVNTEELRILRKRVNR
jgi:hypothetical protein